MTEHEFFTMSVQNNIVDSSRIRKEAASAGKKRIPRFSRILFPVAACFVCGLIAVACIPKARAEVLSWFGWSTSAGDYLGKDPEAREDAAQVDALITQAEGEDGSATVTDEGAFGRVSELLAERLDVTPLEALYDGDSVYVTVSFGDGFGVWLLENYTGGSVASVAIPPEELGDFFSPAVPESYLSGEDVYYSHTVGRLIMTLPDGTAIDGSVCIADSEALSALLEQAAAEPQNVNALVAQFLAENDVKAYAAMKADSERLAALADENGRVEGKLSLLLQIELAGSLTAEPATVLQADVGSIPVDVATYRTFEKTVSGSPAVAKWSGEATMTCFDDSGVGDSTYGYNVYTNHTLSLDGLKMKALSVEMDATGLRKLQVAVTYPDSWSDADIRAFTGAYGIQFQLLINGEAGEWTVDGLMRSFDTLGARERIWYCREVNNVPLGLLPEIRELTLIPCIRCCKAYYELDPDETGERVIRGAITPLELDKPFSLWNEYYGGFDMDVIYYPQYALSFSVPQAAATRG